MSNLLKFISLPANERLLLFQAFLLLQLAPFKFKLFGLKGLNLDLIQRKQKHSNELHSDANYSNKVSSVARMVRIATHYSPFSTSCLIQSVVLLKLLQHQGIIAQLQIGVQKYSGQIKAHAWVEHQGEVLNDTADVSSRYIPFNNPIPF